MCPTDYDRETALVTCFTVKHSVPDELCTIIEPLQPPEPPKLESGRPRGPYRADFVGIQEDERR